MDKEIYSSKVLAECHLEIGCVYLSVVDWS